MSRTIILVAITVGAILLCSCEKPRPGIYASGTVEAREILISSKISGNVTVIHVKRSQEVKAGDMLVEIDPNPYRLQVDEATAALGGAKELLLKARTGLRREEVDRAREGVKAAEAQYKYAKETLERTNELLARGAIARQEYDRVKSQFDMAEANLVASKKQYRLARKGTRKEDIKAANYQVERAKAAVELAKLQESYSKVYSPADTTVSEIYIEEGELVGPGSALILLQDLSEFHIDVFVSINDISKVNDGDPVKIKVTGLPDREFVGAVERVKPRAEFTPENVTTEEGRSHLVFKVRVRLVEGAEFLKPGLPADAWILPKSASTKKAADE